MTPDTMHLCSQLIRHSRGMLTAFEQWLEKQPTKDETPGSLSASRTPRLAGSSLPESTNAHTRAKGL